MNVEKLAENIQTHTFRRYLEICSSEICARGDAPQAVKTALFDKAHKAAEDAYENYKFSFPENWSNALNLTPQEIEKERYDIEFKMRLALYAAASLSMSQEKYIDKTTKTIKKRATYEEIDQKIRLVSDDMGYTDLPVLVKTLIAKHNRKMPNLLTPYLEKE